MCKTGPRVAFISPMQHVLLGGLLLPKECHIPAVSSGRDQERHCHASTCVSAGSARTCGSRRLASIPEELTIEVSPQSQRSRWVSDSCVPPVRPSRSRKKQKKSRATGCGSRRCEEEQRRREPENPRKSSDQIQARIRQALPPKQPRRFLESHNMDITNVLS